MLTHNQTLILTTLREHADGGGKAIGIHEIDRELNRRHNRTMGYDALQGALKRLAARSLVRRHKGRPARWEITTAGCAALNDA